MIDDTCVRTKHVNLQGDENCLMKCCNKILSFACVLQGVKLRGGTKKWRPWATFSRSHKQDFDVQPILFSQHGRAGKIHQVFSVFTGLGALGSLTLPS